MSTNMFTKDIISLIERSDDKYPHFYPTATRIGYAVGLFGLMALSVDDGYTAEEFKETIRGYVATLRQELALAESDEVIAKLFSRELICGDILLIVSQLELNGIEAGKLDVFTNMDTVVDESVNVNENVDVDVIINKTVVVVEENMDANEFVNVTESDAGVSEADATEWELV